MATHGEQSTLFDLGEPDKPQKAVRAQPRATAPPVDWPGFVSVAIQRPVLREFTYAVPEGMLSAVQPGVRVAVRFANRRQVAVVVDVLQAGAATGVPAHKLQPILEVLDDEPVVGEDLLALTRWISERYACSWGEALGAVLPAPLKREARGRRISMISPTAGIGTEQLAELAEASPKQHRLLRDLIDLGEPVELRGFLRRLNLSDSPARTLERKGWVRIERVEAPPDLLGSREPENARRVRPRQLSPAQDAALASIACSLTDNRHTTFLLEGVTGSGKTEVYLRAIEDALARGKSAIVLVPEIALTPQTLSWFRSRFGEVCVLHSAMTDAQRLTSWRLLRQGKVRVVVGARSAVFAPVKDLGIIVVDEEHEPSFKQESVPRYHARDVAVERARRTNAVCILGSATPALESFACAQTGTYKSLRLPERVGGGTRPAVHVVDMKLESGVREGKGKGRPLFSHLLGAFLKETLKAKEQAILFLNRRGFIPILWCPGCEESVRCGQCDMGLTYHRRIERLVCHSCCEEHRVPQACPRCTRPGLRFLGTGSERVESELAKFLPGARIRRMDSDTMRKREDYEQTLSAFERHEIDVLVGTQMIAKGLDFPRVTLVGIVSADSGLHLPDFRASERTFQLIAQVAGRAGRSELPGRIVVQTMSPGEPAIRLGAESDYAAFVRHELGERKEWFYPPYGRLLRVILEDDDERKVEEGAEQLMTALRKEPFVPALKFLGPSPAPMALVRGRHRHNVLIKTQREAPEFEPLVHWLAQWAAKVTRPRIKIDVDPMSMM